jgi:hypothetical protein
LHRIAAICSFQHPKCRTRRQSDDEREASVKRRGLLGVGCRFREPAPPCDVLHLEPDEYADELALYMLLSSGSAPVPRVEQERIPLDVAAARLQDAVDAAAPESVTSTRDDAQPVAF